PVEKRVGLDGKARSMPEKVEEEESPEASAERRKAVYAAAAEDSAAVSGAAGAQMTPAAAGLLALAQHRERKTASRDATVENVEESEITNRVNAEYQVSLYEDAWMIVKRMNTVTRTCFIKSLISKWRSVLSILESSKGAQNESI